MSAQPQAMHVVTNKKTVKGKVYLSILLLHGYRDETGKVKKVTIANLSRMPDWLIDSIRRQVKGEKLVPLDSLMESLAPLNSREHGNVELVLEAMKRLGFPDLVSSVPSPERNIVMAMIVARILRPNTKLSTVSWWKGTTIPEIFELDEDIDEDALYKAMDWLGEQQEVIETQLMRRHLSDGDRAYYDLSPSYFEGHSCPLAEFGYGRDKKRGKRQVNYGILADHQGRPLAIKLFKGNTSDAATFMPMIDTVMSRRKLSKIIFVGDRGMINGKTIVILKKIPDIGWITGLRSVSIRKLITNEIIDPERLKRETIFELESSEEYPGERLIFCRNPFLAEYRSKNRNELLERTEKILDSIRDRVVNGTLKKKTEISKAVSRSINKFKMKKHFIVEIADSSLSYERNTEKISREQSVDGIYAVRTSPMPDVSAPECVRRYKELTKVERCFRSMKSGDLNIRPIHHHHRQDRVESHFFLCMLSLYVIWHLREALRELTFADEEQEAKETSNPVLPAKRSDGALEKIQSKVNSKGVRVQSFRSLLDSMRHITKTTHKVPGSDKTLTVKAIPESLQRRALELVTSINML
jgi:transposase